MGDSEETRLQPAWEQFYLARVEMYLVHKYAPELIDEIKLTFRKAQLRRESFIKKDEQIFSSAEDLINQIVRDIDSAPLRRKHENHHAQIMRPGIGERYQSQFEEL
jgi:hypothetical protein